MSDALRAFKEAIRKPITFPGGYNPMSPETKRILDHPLERLIILDLAAHPRSKVSETMIRVSKQYMELRGVGTPPVIAFLRVIQIREYLGLLDPEYPWSAPKGPSISVDRFRAVCIELGERCALCARGESCTPDT